MDPRIYLSDYKTFLYKKRILIVISDAMIESYSSVLWDIINIASLSHCKLQILLYKDIHPTIKFGLVSLKSLHRSARLTAKKICGDMLKCLDVDFELEVFEEKISQASYVSWNWFYDVLCNNNQELFRSIYSNFLTRNLSTLISRPRGLIRRKLLRADVQTYEYGKRIIAKSKTKATYDLVFVPNGRYPVQVGMKQEAEQSGIQVMYYEKFHNRTFLQSFQTQDTDAMEDYFAVWRSRASRKEKMYWRRWSENWLINQMTSKEHNPFLGYDLLSKTITANQKKRIKFDASTVPIFTSSLDERFSNVKFGLNGWTSQLSAIEKISSKLAEQGFLPHVRLHPNLMSKSVREFGEVVKFLVKNEISFQLPWEGPSTYELISNANLVVTWGATVSLESTARGIRTLNLGPTRFNSITDIALINPDICDNLDFSQVRKPDKTKSLDAIFMTRNYGIQGLWKGRPELNWISGINGLTFLDKIKAIASTLVNYFLLPSSIMPRHIYRIVVWIFGRSAGEQVLSYLSRKVF